MYLSRIKIENFRNFSLLDVSLSGNVVVVGENRVGKSNLLYALRLLLDPTLPDSARQLTIADFWDGLGTPDETHEIKISVEIRDFEGDLDVLALLTDYRLAADAETVRLNFVFRPRPDLEGPPSADEDYEFVCYGGEDEAKDFGHRLRRRITMDLLPALRDAEGDLAAWRRSPLRPLIETAFGSIDTDELEAISAAIEEATGCMAGFEEVRTLEEQIAGLFVQMSGERQDIRPRLGFSPTDPTRLYRTLRLLIDEGRRGIADASLGSANLVFLTLKTLELWRLVEETTHSPHIASVAPLRSILLLKDQPGAGTVGRSTAAIALSPEDASDFARYLDVTRAEMLFARGVVLVEGDAERFFAADLRQYARAAARPAWHHYLLGRRDELHPVCQVSDGARYTVRHPDGLAPDNR